MAKESNWRENISATGQSWSDWRLAAQDNLYVDNYWVRLKGIPNQMWEATPDTTISGVLAWNYYSWPGLTYDDLLTLDWIVPDHV